MWIPLRGTCWWKFEPYQFFLLRCINKLVLYSVSVIGRWKNLTTKFLLINSFNLWGGESEFGSSKLRFFQMFRSSLFRAVSEGISAKTALFSADFAALKNWFFSVDQSWISDVQRSSGNVQCWSELKHCWSALINSESEVISTEIFWDLNPGNVKYGWNNKLVWSHGLDMYGFGGQMFLLIAKKSQYSKQAKVSNFICLYYHPSISCKEEIGSEGSATW